MKKAQKADRRSEQAGVNPGCLVRQGATADLDTLVAMRVLLWPDTAAADHLPHVRAILDGKPDSTMPLVILVAQDREGKLVGFIEVGLRSHADGCDFRTPVGFVEGWFVQREARRQGVGRALIAAAEQWFREQGCKQIASDTWTNNSRSIRAHQALGFQIVDRCVNFMKAL